MVTIIILLSVTVSVLAVLVTLLILRSQHQSDELKEKNRVIVREVQRRAALEGRLLVLLAPIMAIFL
ncbi:MAG: hypothetical protein IKR98_01630 [Bacteroidaceae bacterium]|nr:hypothetical protein [Bacteroidaceae bacterium]